MQLLLQLVLGLGVASPLAAAASPSATSSSAATQPPSTTTFDVVPRAKRISCNAYNISYSTSATMCRARGCCWDGTAQPLNSQIPCYYATPAVPIKKVVIIDVDHFDLGYHGLVADVANMYFDTFWPLALNISRELRARNRTETYTYTTFSWLVSTYLHCPPNAGLHCPSVAQLLLVRSVSFKIANHSFDSLESVHIP
jgi:hypothetical protein